MTRIGRFWPVLSSTGVTFRRFWPAFGSTGVAFRRFWPVFGSTEVAFRRFWPVFGSTEVVLGPCLHKHQTWPGHTLPPCLGSGLGPTLGTDRFSDRNMLTGSTVRFDPQNTVHVYARVHSSTTILRALERARLRETFKLSRIYPKVVLPHFVKVVQKLHKGPQNIRLV